MGSIMPPTSRQIKTCIEIAESIAKIQGNIFIKELLRKRKQLDPTIIIGINKDEIIQNLIAAIREGKITRLDLDDWIKEVEGWGNQHVYLYEVTRELANNSIWSSTRRLMEKIKGTPLNRPWGKSVGLKFPEKLKLTRVYFADNKFECVWLQKVTNLKREASKDLRDKKIRGDLYDFRAYRHTPIRTVMRFEMDLRDKIAALFVQIPLKKEHIEAVELAEKTLNYLFNINQLKRINTSRAIKNLDKFDLDSAEIEKSLVKARNTKFESSGASVEFSANSRINAWKDVRAVREVRLALKDDNFSGENGKFIISLQDRKGMKRDTIMSISGITRRLYLHSQMTAEEVWEVLSLVKKHSF